MNIGVLTDEFEGDLDTALAMCERLGVASIELRTIDGRPLLAHDDDELRRILRHVTEGGFSVPMLATPIFKCPLSGTGAPSDAAMHGARHATLDENWALLDRALELAASVDVGMIRIFSCWREPDPALVFDQVVDLVRQAQHRASLYGVEVLLENEHDCNIATAAETAALLDCVPGLRVIWDPANHVRAGGPASESALLAYADRIGHVHVKDVKDGAWTVLGNGVIPYQALIDGLSRASYGGTFSLETHCEIDGSRNDATATSLHVLRDLMVAG